MRLTPRWIEGWTLFALLAAALIIMSGGLFLWDGGDSDAARLVIRATARTSLICFLAAFAASATVRLWPRPFTYWLRRNRRQFGLAFALSHLIHATAIIALHRIDPSIFWRLTTPGSIISGSIAYAFIAAMAAPSFDAAVRAMGPRTWGILHRVGTWFIALSFLIANGKRIPASGTYAIPVAALLVVVMLRRAAHGTQLPQT
ncbi:MAG: ferric reductase-like transmembrane domain-containing protein [Sphingopyxis sp.]|uniref:ferric reductase-like transmembrane domain-containing protein n=1 Tax=Sphingopyxis sp. TaxID=1908224 RepID=UPI002ABC7784|nr:ferric reductase-like transmembrane domain-containing protein [Sphingopyxis sp.]MDZ3832191.1 ferric reductase-like transmembrane domain-containing protein [Sphingopyxis sp.]